MSRHLDFNDPPDSVVRFAHTEGTASRHASIEEVLTVGVEVLRKRAHSVEGWLDCAWNLRTQGAAARDCGVLAKGMATEMAARGRACVDWSGP